MNGRVLAVDPGDKRLGLAVSDPSAMIANPLTVISHISRQIDAGVIAQLARDHDVILIVVGQALDDEGEVGPRARSAQRLAEAIRQQTPIAVELWDESGSTRSARSARFEMGVSRKKRSGHLDELAATVILQSYLDAHV
jgi:putative Holliday junction resolvase